MRVALCIVALFVILAPLQQVAAHEVYVLDPATIAHDTVAQSPNPLGAVLANRFEFFFWGFIALLTVATVFCMSIFQVVEKALDPALMRLKRWAPLVTRVTLGVCLIACAYYGGLFGPELPLGDFAGPWAPAVVWLLYLSGTAVLFGFFTRAAAVIALVVFCFSVVRYGSYMLTYANYLGEILITLILGGGLLSFDRLRVKNSFNLTRVFEPYAFLVMRVGFGVSVIFAALYAKFLHSDLALDTVARYHLTDFFHFDPLFIVLGAFVIESLIGVFIILGLELRWTALFFLFWLALSLLYFGEAVWPHLVLLGLNLALVCRGYDMYTLEGRFFKHRLREPVL